MGLTAKEAAEIAKIQANFTEDDFDFIRSEVERRVNLKRENPLHAGIERFERAEFTQAAADQLYLDDPDYQELIETYHWNLQEKLVSREHALSLWRDAQSFCYSEVA